MLAKLGIETVADLVTYYPREYLSLRLVPVGRLAEVDGETVVVRGKIISPPVIDRRRPKMTLLKCQLADGSGSVQCVWFNQPYLQRQLTRGRLITVTGRYSARYRTLAVDKLDLAGNEPPGIEPIYRLTEGLSNAAMRTIVANALKGYQAEDLLPQPFRSRYRLMELGQALQAVHCPQNCQQLEQGRYRLKFEELFLYQLTFRYWRQLRRAGQGHAHKHLPSPKQLEEIFGFKLTPDQIQAMEEIGADMAKPAPMHRLLQGDVGSGKTAVAAYALLCAGLNGCKGVLMAPTEILARQHYHTLKPVADYHSLPLVLFTGGVTTARRSEILERLGGPGELLVVGTHALFQQKVQIEQLSLVVTDEQHRFGVQQRLALASKGANPDVLAMSATPIPRTLAMSMYGDLDITTLKAKPPGRLAVKTCIVANSRRGKVLEFITSQLAHGNCGYIVCPLIEQSNNIDAFSVDEYHSMLQRELPSWVKIEVLHGRMDSEAKEQAMERLKQRQAHLLLATTVVEVGVDVPGATFIVIENSERYGLAQLHQLRGRVGRSGHQGWCFLMSPPAEISRLRVLERSNDGFEIAQADLELRGPGQYLGVRQHGLNEMKIASPWRDTRIVEKARQAVDEVLPQLTVDETWQPIQRLVVKNIEKLKS